MSDQHNLLNDDKASLEAYFLEMGESSYRAQQVLKWIYHEGITDFSAMTNLKKSLRCTLQQKAVIKPPKIITEQQSIDGTRKWLMQIDDHNSVETVFIPERDRGTLCISSQVGCPLNCKFCATAQQGFNRNLTTDEIIGQVWIANKKLGYFEHGKRIITNIVFMGMGEPLLNYNNVIKTINLLTDDLGFGFSRRRVTVSTAGVVPEIERLKNDSNVNLAISLHASNNELRNHIVPLNRSYSLPELLAACKRFAQARGGHAVTIEYVMLHNVNDSLQDAQALVQCLRDFPTKVNLIPFNQFAGTDYTCSSASAINAFRDILMKAGIITVTRKTRGDDIDAACGQLVGKVAAKAARHQKNQMERIE